MEDQTEQLIDESIELEMNTAELYRAFSKTFPEDSDFWEELSLEEKRHASLLKDAKKILYEFPLEILSSKLQELLGVNKKVKDLVKKHKKTNQSRKSAFETALIIEQSAGEVHYQRAMEKPPTSMILGIFQELNDGDKDHAKRIREYMTMNHIQ